MKSIAKSGLLVATIVICLTTTARAEYCRDWLASLVRTGDMKPDMNFGEAKGLHVRMFTQAKNYEVVLHCLEENVPKWITITAPSMIPPDDWYYTVVRIGALLQGWKSEELDRAVRKCHRDAAIKKDGFISPPGLECWVSDARSMIAVWPPGTK